MITTIRFFQHRPWAIAALAVLVWSECALAQLQFTGDPRFSPDYPMDSPLESGFVVDPLNSNTAVSPTLHGFHVTGDVTLKYDRTHSPAPESDQGDFLFQLVAERPFTVGPLPVKVRGGLVEEFEVVLGNGSLIAPELTLRTYVDFLVFDGSYAPINSLFAFGVGDGYGATLAGNSFEVFHSDNVTDEFILGPGFNYVMQYRIESWVKTSQLTLNDPPPTVTFEFGGVSEFAGMEASAIGVLLPEPPSYALAGIGMAMLGICVRRNRHRFRNGMNVKSENATESGRRALLTSLRIMVVTMIALAASPLHAGFVIDDFEEGGPFALSADQTIPFSSYASSPINVPGATRTVELCAPELPGYFVNSELSATAGDDALTFTGQNPPNEGFGAANIFYGSTTGQTSLHLDLAPFGDRFYIDVVDDTPFLGYRLFVLAFAHGTGVFSHDIPIVPDGSGHYEIPFSSFAPILDTPFDPTDIDRLGLWLIASEVRDGDPALKITEFGVVPEPSSIVLAVLGAFLAVTVAMRRRAIAYRRFRHELSPREPGLAGRCAHGANGQRVSCYWPAC